MNEANSTPAQTGNNLRLTPTLNALWIGGPAALDQATAVVACERLLEAVRMASRLWPEFYKGDGIVRLVHGVATPPAAEIIGAAQRLGMAVTPIDATAQSGAEQCDLALAAPSVAGDVAAALPILANGRDGDGGDLTIYDPALSLLPPGRRRGRPEGSASALEIAHGFLAPPHRAREMAKLRDYQNEDMRASPARYEYDLLLRAIGEPMPAATGPDLSWHAAAALAEKAGPASATTIETLRAEYERADAQALAYGQRWRSTLATRSFMLLLGSVMSGLVGTLFPALTVVTLPAQVLATALIFIDKRYANHHRWREKWLEYRRLAEVARIARFCVLAGAPIPDIGSGGWLDWRLLRAVRAAPPTHTIAPEQAKDVLDHLRSVEIAEQIAYHHRAFRRFRRLDARFKRAASVALFATMALGGIFAILALLGVGKGWTISLLAAVSLALSAAPGLYAALDGLRDRLDVARQAQRSGRIAAGLRRLARVLSDAPPSPALVRTAALRAAVIMSEDVTSFERVMGVV